MDTINECGYLPGNLTEVSLFNIFLEMTVEFLGFLNLDI